MENRFIPITFIIPHVIRNDVRKVLGDNGESIYGFDKFVEFYSEYKNGKITLYLLIYQIVLTSYPINVWDKNNNPIYNDNISLSKILNEIDKIKSENIYLILRL